MRIRSITQLGNRFIGLVPLVVLVLGLACRDERERPAPPTEPTMAVTGGDSLPAGASSVCRAYLKELGAVQLEDSTAADATSRQRRAALRAVVDDACR